MPAEPDSLDARPAARNESRGDGEASTDDTERGPGRAAPDSSSRVGHQLAGDDEPEVRLAPHRLRLVAFVADGLLFAVLFGVGLVLGNFTGPAALLLSVAAGVAFVYYMAATTWLTHGQTAGKALAGLRVRRIDGALPSHSRRELAWSFGRHSVGYLIADVLLLGTVSSLFTPRRRCLHDYAFGSEVVLVRGGEEPARALDRLSAFLKLWKARHEEVEKEHGWILWPLKWLTRVVSAIAAFLSLPMDALAAGPSPLASAAPAAKPLSLKGGVALWTTTTVATGAVITGIAMVVPQPDHNVVGASWTRITPTRVNFAEVALARGPDGVLHVVWAQSDGLTSSLKHQGISASGALLRPPDLVVAGWDGITDNPDVVVTPDGRLHAFFAGRSMSEGLLGVAVATSDSGGKTWSAPRRASAGTEWSYVASPGAGVAADGTPVVAWTTTSHTPLYRFLGASRASPDVGFGSGCCVQGAKIVTDAGTRQTVLGWYWSPLGQGTAGFYVQPITPAKLIGASSRAPDAASSDQRTAITSRRAAPGIFLAYANADWTGINVWRYGDAAARVVARGNDLYNVGITTGPDGRLWVFWESAERYYATRSNREATRFGRVVSVAPPPGTASTTYGLFGEGSLGPLDLFAHVQTSPRTLVTWHKRVLPGLTVTCTSGSPIDCEVTDAGDPVPGATVRVGTRTLRTDSRGTISVQLPAGRHLVVASKTGYTQTSFAAKAGS